VTAPNRYYANALPTTLSSAINNSTTTVVLTSLPGTWPTSYPFSLLIEWGTTNFEVIKVTQAPTGTGPYTFANCVRGDDGTTAISHLASSPAAHGFTQRDFTEPQSHIAATTQAHGLGSGSAVVGTTDTQTLYGKQLYAGASGPGWVTVTLTGGATAVQPCKYRAIGSPPNEYEVIGAVTSASNLSNVNIFTLPQAPSTQQIVQCEYSDASNIVSGMCLTTGAIQLSTVYIGKIVYFHGFIAMDYA